jgi:hypothetical protein
VSEVSRQEFDALKAKVDGLDEVVRRLHEGLLHLQETLDKHLGIDERGPQ